MGERSALPLGTYRLKIEGKRYVGGAASWPWPTESYQWETDSFELLPAEIRVEASDSGFTPLFGWAVGWMENGGHRWWPSRRKSRSRVGDGHVWEMDDGSEMEEDVDPTISQGKSWIDISRLRAQKPSCPRCPWQ